MNEHIINLSFLLHHNHKLSIQYNTSQSGKKTVCEMD
jgi:hypothetical protein